MRTRVLLWGVYEPDELRNLFAEILERAAA